MSVHEAHQHDSAYQHVSGAARYLDDLPLPHGALHLAFGLAGIAHGSIATIDLAAVRAAEGVRAVLQAADLPFANDISSVPAHEPLLSEGDISYHAQPIFLVAAESHLLARKAARKATITYAQAPPLLSLDDALAAESFIEEPRFIKKGDAAAAIVQAEHCVEGEITLGGQEHFYLESQAALAIPQENGGMEIHSSSQHPSEIQHKVAEAIGGAMHDVRVMVRRMGGGFGGKESQGNAPAVACAVVARLLGKATAMRYDRDDDMQITGKRHDCRICYRVGFDSTGRIAGLEFTQLLRCGFSQDLSLAIADRAMLHADNAYHLPHVSIASYRLRTHTASNTAFRGFGGPQGMVGIERVIDHMAHVLQCDPLGVRKVNFYAPPKAKLRQSTPYHMIVEDCVIGELVADLEKSSEYHRRRAALADWNAESPILKKGIALTPVKFGISFTLSHLNQAGALVHVYHDGSVQVHHGGTEMGQGLYVKMAQIAAEELGLGLSAIGLSATDTAKVPNTSATAASSGADLNGMAVQRACRTIKARLAHLLAERYQTSAAEIEFVSGTVRIKDEVITFAEAAKIAHQARLSLSANGFYATPKIVWDRDAGRGRPFYYFAYGAACSEVVVDTLSGEYRILRSDLLLDAGKSLNPAIDLGQLEGGFVQGAGWLTSEELLWDSAGRLLTHAPSTYKIPACSCRPEVMHSALWKKGRNRESTTYRSKAVGEPPLMLGISVFLALSDALGATRSDYPALDAPATPERILGAIPERSS